MPVIRKASDPARPERLEASAFGLFRVPRGDPAALDRHRHDADGIWFMVEAEHGRPVPRRRPLPYAAGSA